MKLAAWLTDEFRRTGTLNPMPEVLWERFQTLPVGVPEYGIEMDVVLASDSTPERMVFDFRYRWRSDEWRPAWPVITGGRYLKVEAVHDLDAAGTFMTAFRRVFAT